MNINFDMDGTIADLYGVENWLEYLINEDVTPYREAKPLLNLQVLARKLNRLQKRGHKINIISWLSKNGSQEYNKAVIATKIKWLSKHFKSVKWDNISIVEYGTPKSTCGNGILFDDEKRNRDEWCGIAFDEKNILKNLAEIA